MKGEPRKFRDEILVIDKEKNTHLKVRRVKISLHKVYWTISQNGILIDSYLTKRRAMKQARRLRRDLKHISKLRRELRNK